MSSWVKSQYYFDERCAVLILVRDDTVFDALTTHEGDIDAIEKLLREIIEHHRPELKGAVLHSVHFSPIKVAWEILLSHPSLPKLKYGAAAARFYLDPRVLSIDSPSREVSNTEPS